MKRTTTFTKGSGAYKCDLCGRLTRNDGNGDSVNMGYCSQCYELSGLENTINDDGETPELVARCEALRNEIVKRGGKLPECAA